MDFWRVQTPLLYTQRNGSHFTVHDSIFKHFSEFVFPFFHQKHKYKENNNIKFSGKKFKII